MKLTEELIKEIVKCVEAGISNKAICDGLGFSQKSFYRWMKKPEFATRLNKAHINKKGALLAGIYNAGRKNWQAYAWLLERCYPDEFGKPKQALELTGKQGAPLIPPPSLILDFGAEE